MLDALESGWRKMRNWKEPQPACLFPVYPCLAAMEELEFDLASIKAQWREADAVFSKAATSNST